METNAGYEYDVALSFADEERPFVRAVAEALRRHRVRVFYDKHEEAVLWGKDLYVHLDTVYREKAKYCIVFVSQNYAEKLWTKFELRSAQARAFLENKEYILPARFDQTQLPGVPDTAAYIDVGDRTPEQFAQLVMRKLQVALPRQLIASAERASDYVTSLLEPVEDDFLAVDDSICLCYGEVVDEASSSFAGALPQQPTTIRPTRAQLEQLIAGEAWSPEVRDHLISRLPADVDFEHSEWKLGVRRMIKAAPSHSQPLTLELGSWLWWVEREFNRQLLKGSDGPLGGMSSRLARRLLVEDNDAGTYEYRFPSSLYVEIAVVGDDSKVLLLKKKSSQGSHMAQRGMRWTCAVEEGAKVSDLSSGALDLRAVARRGLREELGIEGGEVEDIQLGAIALQARHLNTAVLGVARIRRPAEQLARQAADRKFGDFSDGEAVPLMRARELLEYGAPDKPLGSWHATARLRLALVLAQLGS